MLDRSQQGVSLIELLVGVAILGILTTMAVPAYTQFLNNTYIRNATEGVQNGLVLARAEALRRNTLIEFRLSADSGWTYGCVAPGSAACPTVMETRTGSEGVRNVSLNITPAGATTITFNGLGRVRNINDDGSARIQQIDFDSTVLDASESRELRTRVSLAGTARTCDPNVDSTDPRHCF